MTMAHHSGLGFGLIIALEGWNIVTGDDLRPGTKAHGRCDGVFARFGRCIGYLAPPGLNHLFFDDTWERIGAATGCMRWMMDVKVAHRPKTYSNKADDTAEKIKSFQTMQTKPDSALGCIMNFQRLAKRS